MKARKASRPHLCSAMCGVAVTYFLILAGNPITSFGQVPTNGKTIPEHVYSPYYTSNGATDTSWATSGVKYFTLAFLQTATTGDPCTVYWNGSTSTPVSTTGNYATGITRIRANGGDVIPSFGGSAADTYSGSTGFFPELADRCTDVSKIAAEYERVITTLNVTRVDLDTEEDSLRNPPGIDRRNKALAMVQAWATANNRVVEWVYTLPTNVAGLDAGVDGSNYTEGAGVLRNAILNGTRIDKVDIMTFDYYDPLSYSGPPHNMGADTITAATHLYDTLRELFPAKTSAELWNMIGFCEDVGRDDFGANETYYLTDATTDMQWAVANGLAIVTFWNYSRDTANRGGTNTPAYSFSKIFDPFTGWATTDALSSSADPSSSSQGVTFMASIAAVDPGLSTPTGTVQFSVDGVDFGSPVGLDGTGNASSAVISSLSSGVHTISAAYSGDSVFSTTTTTLTQAVGVPIPSLAIPTINLLSSENPSAFPDPVTFTATVSGSAGTPTGTVQFQLDDVDLSPCCEGANGPVALNGSGQAMSAPIDDLPHPWPASGPHRVTAIYSGDSNYQSAVSTTLVQNVNNCGECAITVSVASSPNPAAPGKNVTFTWDVEPADGVGSPTGSVQIVADGTNVLGTWPSISFNAGTVQVQSSTLPAGVHSITAVYSGDADFKQTTSPVLTQIIGQAQTGTSVSSTGFVMNRATNTYNGTFTITNTSSQVITGPIEMVLSNLPAGVTGANSAGMFNGNPYWVITTGSLAAGAKALVTVEFSKTSPSLAITYTATIY